MKPKINRRHGTRLGIAPMQEILILADGRVMAHNLTPGMAMMLRELNPGDKRMQQRVRNPKHGLSHEL